MTGLYAMCGIQTAARRFFLPARGKQGLAHGQVCLEIIDIHILEKRHDRGLTARSSA
jgi:hypothetical protein